MKKSFYVICMLLMLSATYYSCNQSADSVTPDQQVSGDVITRLVDLGFDVTNQPPFKFENGYLVEGDIFLTDNDLVLMKSGVKVPAVEQYSTNNLIKVTKPKAYTIFLPSTFDATYSAALDEAIARYNAQGLAITFSRSTGTGSRPTIIFRRLDIGSENQGVLGSSGFPTSYGTPFGEVKMSGVLSSRYGLSVNGIATIMAHEIGHCIGFRHTDYFNRRISCGGKAFNEGDGGIGANHIEGTPTGATRVAKSWMLSCTDGGDRPFNSDDIIALKVLYGLK